MYDQINVSTRSATTESAEPQGQVIAQLPNGRVRVEAAANATCQRCASGRGCGFGLTQSASALIDCDAEGRHFEIGERVAIQLCQPGGHWLWTVVCGYGLSTFGLLSGVLAGAAASAGAGSVWHDLIPAATGLVGLAGGLLAWRVVAEGLHLSAGLGPHVRPIRTHSVSLEP